MIGYLKLDRFYYDFFFANKTISDSDLASIKKEMDMIIRANYPITREEVTREEARYFPIYI